MDDEVQAIIEAVIITVIGLSLLPTVTTAITSAVGGNLSSDPKFAGVVSLSYVVGLFYVIIIVAADAGLLMKAFKRGR